jgi:hypothetical protein
VRSSRRSPHSHRSRAKLDSHGTRGSHRIRGEQQRRPASRHRQRFPYRGDRTWRD